MGGVEMGADPHPLLKLPHTDPSQSNLNAVFITVVNMTVSVVGFVSGWP